MTGLLPVGAYMVVHLFTNASILNGTEAFQNAVYMIHSLGNALVLVEWAFIFLPLIFHALIGFWIIFEAKNNVGNYPLERNWRYTLQRITGMIAAVFILHHVIQLNGIIHAEPIRETVLEPVKAGQFRPYNAASTAADALQWAFPLMAIWYAIGITACVYHFANGIWTMGITWGVWTAPHAQRWASHVCMGIGAIVLVVGMSALVGMCAIDVEKARERENEMYQQRVKDGSILPNPHKLFDPKRLEKQDK